MYMYMHCCQVAIPSRIEEQGVWVGEEVGHLVIEKMSQEEEREDKEAVQQRVGDLQPVAQGQQVVD